MGSPVRANAAMAEPTTFASRRASSSVGFLASNVDPTPAWIAAEDVWPWLELEGGASKLRE